MIESGSITGIFGNILTSRGDFAVLKREFPVALLEYCTPVWSAHYRRHKDLLKRVQHRFIRMFSHLRHLEYDEKLNILGLWSLEERQNRADLLA